MYCSYNTAVGWAALQPLRELLIQHAALSRLSGAARAQDAHAFAARFAATSPAYFSACPPAVPMLEELRGKGWNYLAHEYLNRDWDCFDHLDVARDFAESKLTFAGSADLLLNFDELNLTAQQRQFLAGRSDPSFRESLKDYVWGTRFREDIFVRGLRKLSAEEMRAAWDLMAFALAEADYDGILSLRTSIAELSLQAELDLPILDRLAQGAAGFRELLALSEIRNFGIAALVDFVRHALADLGEQIIKNGTVVSDPKQVVAELEGHARTVFPRVETVLRRTGILDG